MDDTGPLQVPPIPVPPSSAPVPPSSAPAMSVPSTVLVPPTMFVATEVLELGCTTPSGSRTCCTPSAGAKAKTLAFSEAEALPTGCALAPSTAAVPHCPRVTLRVCACRVCSHGCVGVDSRACVWVRGCIHVRAQIAIASCTLGTHSTGYSEHALRLRDALSFEAAGHSFQRPQP